MLLILINLSSGVEMGYNCNCIYSWDFAMCNNKNVKRSWILLGARPCHNYYNTKKCKYSIAYTDVVTPPPPPPKINRCCCGKR